MDDFSEALDALWDFDDPVGSERRFTEAAVGENRAEALTQVARALGLQKRFDEALAVLEEAKEDERPLVAARVALERGRILGDFGGDPVPEFRAALNLCLQNGLAAYAVDAMHMLAICATGEEAIALNTRALEMAENSQSERARQWRASLQNNLGWSYFGLGQYTEALECFEKAVALRKERNEVKQEAIARWCVARALRALGRTEEALDIQLCLIAQDDTGFAHEEVGECMLQKGDENGAKPYFAEAAERLKGKIDETRLERLRRLGGL